MSTKYVASFEILAQPVAPGVPNIPYVQQGFFIQLTNIGAADAGVQSLYTATPGFVAAKGAIKLFANYIDQTGSVTQYPDSTFLEAPIGFGNFVIPAGATWLFGVQYLLLPPPAPIITGAGGSTPQDTFGTRGSLQLTAAAGTTLLALATVRQVFNNYSPGGTLLDVAEAAYSVPVLGGPELVF